MYSFKENIPVGDFEEFVSHSSFAPIQQTKAWAELKNNWEHFFCGIYRDETLCGVCLILVRKILPTVKHAYAPRGPILDFSDKEAVSAFRDGVFSFCKKHGASSFMCDPEIPVAKTLPSLPEENYYDPVDVEKGRRDFENLVSAGFIHGGFGKELHSALQPRYNAMIPLKKADGTLLLFDELKKNFKPSIRRYFGTFQTFRGLEFEHSDDVAGFKKILSNTEERQHISLRGESYFSLMQKSFGDDFYIGIEYCDVKKYIANLEEKLEKENTEKNADLLAEAKKALDERGEKIPLAAALNIFPPNKDGVKVVEYLYGGSDLNVFPSFHAPRSVIAASCTAAAERNADFLNLGGLAGTFDDGLYNFKERFSPIIVEFAGEFELKINKGRYAFMKKCLPAMQKTYKKLIKLIKK